KDLVGLGHVERERGRDVVTSIEEVRRQPEEFLEERRQIVDARSGILAVDDGARRTEREKALLELRRPLVWPAHALVGEHGGGEDEALDGLDHAQPCLVHASEGVAHSLVSGQSTTSPTGSRRRSATSYRASICAGSVLASFPIAS